MRVPFWRGVKAIAEASTVLSSLWRPLSLADRHVILPTKLRPPWRRAYNNLRWGQRNYSIWTAHAVDSNR